MFKDLLLNLTRCEACTARKEARLPVLSVGSTRTEGIMVIGRNPGRQEDEKGVPFVGRSGEFLNEYLEKCGIKRNDCYITNTVKCHTFGNREPDILEITTCIKLWLNREIIYLQPKLIFILGADAYRGVFKIGLSPWMKNTGIVRDLRKEYGFRAVILPHPSAIISYAPHWKSKYDDTVEQVKAIIKEENL